jgi:ParB-like chromosome segregation protein Spo0J
MQGSEVAERVVRIEMLGERLCALRLCEAVAVTAMQQSLSRLGQLCAVAVFTATTGELEVVDGFKRLRAARALGWSELRVQALDVDAAGAKIAIYALAQKHGLTELEEAWLVRSLYREDHLSQPQIARQLSRDKSWVCRRLMIAEALDDAVQADVRLGLVSPSAAAALARLPRCNQRPAAEVVAKSGMTFRQTARLVDELLGSKDESARAALLDTWRRSPPPRAAPHPVRRARSEAQWLMSDIAALCRIGARLQARLLAKPLSALAPGGAAELAARALGSLALVLAALGRTITHVTGDPDVAVLEQPRTARAPDGHALPAGPFASSHCSGAGGEPQYGS